MSSASLLFTAFLPGGGEWVWIFIIILVLFGGSRLPSLAKGMGQAVKEFKKASKEDSDEEKPAGEPKKGDTGKSGGSSSGPTHGQN